jgi:hypothetical protein
VMCDQQLALFSSAVISEAARDSAIIYEGPSGRVSPLSPG